ncbi:MAG: transposase zinc-binding domain-containing protein [Syntrophaceae bacterium]
MIFASSAVYRPQNPPSSNYYRCIEYHFETFVQVYEERGERQYGFFRSYIQKVVHRYLDCGDLRKGFARVNCKDCGHEYLLAFSCKPYCFHPIIFTFIHAARLRT